MKIKNECYKLLLPIFWILKEIKYFIPGLILIMLIEAAGALSGVAIAISSKNMVDYAVAGNLSLACIAAVFFGGVILLNLGMRIGRSLLGVKISEKMSNTIRQRFFNKLMNTEWLALSAYHSGDLLTRLTSDVGAIVNCVVSVIPGILGLGVQLVAAFLTLLHYEPRLAVLAFILGPVTVLFSRVWGRKLKNLQIKVQESESAYRSFIQEALQNITIIKCFQQQSYNQDLLQELHNTRMNWVIARNHTTLTASTIMGLGYWIGYFFAFGWGAIRLSQKAISFGTMTAFLQLVGQVQGPFSGLAQTLPQIIAAFASTERLITIEDLETEKAEENMPHVENVGIHFNQTGFCYTEGQPVLNEVSAEIKPGEVVALVGPSGEGKTTIIRLLLALLKPSEGELFFTDSFGNRYEVSAATREWITYVPQGNTLFSGTIADNLRYGRTDATKQEMEKALRTASAWEFIEKLPDGMDTVIGEKGLGLSEGQAQRIAIARAFLRKAPLLILDEATSSLDMKSEMNVLNAVKDLKPGCTCLVITHRPSALKICTRVMRLQDSRLADEAV